MFGKWNSGLSGEVFKTERSTYEPQLDIDCSMRVNTAVNHTEAWMKAILTVNKSEAQNIKCVNVDEPLKFLMWVRRPKILFRGTVYVKAWIAALRQCLKELNEIKYVALSKSELFVMKIHISKYYELVVSNVVQYREQRYGWVVCKPLIARWEIMRIFTFFCSFHVSFMTKKLASMRSMMLVVHPVYSIIRNISTRFRLS